MPVAHRSLRLTAQDLARVEVLRDRCGSRTTASEAVRAALASFIGRAKRSDDVTVTAEQLTAEAGTDEPGWKVWGFSLPEDEAQALDTLVADPPAGVKRKFSRNEIVRLAILLAAGVDAAQLRAAYEGLPRLVRGRSKKADEAPKTT